MGQIKNIKLHIVTDIKGITRMPSDIDQVASMMSKSSVEDVKLVSFAGRKLKVDTADDAKEIVDAIKSTVDITALRLEGNTIGLEAAIEIAKALKIRGNLRKHYGVIYLLG